MTAPARGFPRSEYEARVARAQQGMVSAGLDAVLLTTEADIRYVTGFLTRFWESPTRPWYVLLPAAGSPVAVIPAIGAALMERTWVSDIRTWNAPDPEDDGVSLLADTIRSVVGSSARLGVPMMMESHLRMPLSDWHRLQTMVPSVDFTDDADTMRRIRMVKSEAEIAKVRHACAIAGRAFDRVPEIARAGVPLDRVFRQFQSLCLDEGADWVPYLAGAADRAGYHDVISPADDRPLANGDVLMLDTGLIWDGYFCDFDRNFAVGKPLEQVTSAHARLIEAVRAGMDMARPGAMASDLFHAMDRVLGDGERSTDAGRLGHGLGLQLTEGLSLIARDNTMLQAGMIITLEPGITLANGRILVHEEDIVIREGGAEYLSPPASGDIVVLGG
ncbi:M24 family metallopeptidase [Sedimentitalea sp. XS_ASV28]|uniref:M24 family metallopeptidase n=1 Tax=Sedimentitalea sp. XS_ASV28 TaxID=3241296 RepID=UPI003515049A